MDIILHNFIADMPGSNFLGFYALVIVATLILCWILNYVADYSRFLPIPSIPKQPDPYEIAYLRDGEKGVAEVAVFNLIRQGFLKIGSKSEQRVQQASTGISSASQLCPMECCVFDWFARPRRKLEVASNHYMDIGIEKQKELDLIAAHFALIPHGLNLSLGSAEGGGQLCA